MIRAYVKKIFPIILPAALGIFILGGLCTYAYIRIQNRVTALSDKVNYLTNELASSTSAFSMKTDSMTGVISGLDRKTKENLEIAKKGIETVQTRVGGFEEKVGEISGTVSILDKLSKIDPELLQKYSKVFFLNEHYIPGELTQIDTAYLYSDRKPIQMHALVWPHLKELIDRAKKDDINLYIKSAYRSFDEQKSIKSAYSVTYGSGTANQFSAEQGYSEHQLGTTVDFITTGLDGGLVGFERTSPYSWLHAFAYRYGFILSYYKGNAYYTFEPWHWRYVGIKLATYLHDHNKHFYDLDQREIDVYRIHIFE